jgi:hypothetical protein
MTMLENCSGFERRRRCVLPLGWFKKHKRHERSFRKTILQRLFRPTNHSLHMYRRYSRQSARWMKIPTVLVTWIFPRFREKPLIEQCVIWIIYYTPKKIFNWLIEGAYNGLKDLKYNLLSLILCSIEVKKIKTKILVFGHSANNADKNIKYNKLSDGNL